MSHPSVFYKYTTAATAIKILESGRLRWSSPKLFNDLSEFQRMPRFEPTLVEACPKYPVVLVKAAFGDIEIKEPRLSKGSRDLLTGIRQLREAGHDREALLEDLPCSKPDADKFFDASLRRFFDPLIEASRVLCVTTEYDIQPMWAHYAEDHAGCVLGLRHIPSKDTPLMEARRIEYTSEPPVVGLGLDFLLYGDTPDLRAKSMDAVCFSKKADWSYEREWRVLDLGPSEEDVFYTDVSFYPDELESVTLGPRATAETETSVRSFLQSTYSKCSLYRFGVEHGEGRRVEA